MGTNRRSRRRSAARILNPPVPSKRQKSAAESDEDNNYDSFPPPSSPDDLEVQANTDIPHDTATMDSLPISSPRLDEANNNITTVGNSKNDFHIQTPTFTSAEICSFELMDLLDNAGCPMNTYEQILCLLRKHEKQGFSYSRAHSRDKLLNELRKKFHSPTIQSTIISKCEVFSFPFLDMLQDLIDTAWNHLHTITPNNCSHGAGDDELWNSEWMTQTFGLAPHTNFNPEKDIMLPIILYVDKTGTDTLQRYSLEPLLFTTAALNRESRENRRFWRHLGFIPSSKNIEDSKDSLQFYHQCLGSILNGLKDAQHTLPCLRVKNSNGVTNIMRAHLPLMIIMGDQLSQDTLCCRRKVNAGGAGRVHRSCMCSYLSTDDHEGNCQPVPKDLIYNMIRFATRSLQEMEDIINKESTIENKAATTNINSRTMKYFRKQKQMFNLILSKPFTTHPVVSAFHGMDFGAWTSGVYDAAFDDFMHSCEEGLMENIGTTLFEGLVSSETEKIESLMTPLLTSSRSSVRSTYPRWRLQKGFSRQTLMTMGERVGSVFSIALALHNKEIAQTFNEGHTRQRTKYSTFAGSMGDNEGEMFYEPYMHKMAPDVCKNTIVHLLRHGFDINIIQSMDPFQINQLIYNTANIFERTSYPESYPEFATIEGMYTDLGSKPRVEQRLLNIVNAAMNPKKDNIFRKQRLVTVASCVPKHHKRKNKQKGDGSTCAFLGFNISSLILFLEYTLCYHSFCKYSSSLPSHMREDLELIDYSGRSLVAYFSRMIYRGDGSIDSRTTKIHTQRRLGVNFGALGNVMHGCCEIGERLLKTEAKKISRTAQQRGNTIFERQTCSRILDRHLLDKMRTALQQPVPDTISSSRKPDRFSRQFPHFILSRSDTKVVACDRKGNQFDPNQSTGRPSLFTCEKLLEVETDLEVIEIYNEVVLRDGSYVRAYPNYRGEGPWFDFVNIQWEDENGEPYFLPAQCLAFYKKNDECMVLIHSVDMNSDGRITSHRNSILTTHYKMQCTRNNIPVTYSINCASIDSALLCFNHETNQTSTKDACRTVMIVRPRNEWAYAWYVWNQHLRAKNSKCSHTKPMVDLGNDEMIVKVRKEVEKTIKEHGKTQFVPSH